MKNTSLLFCVFALLVCTRLVAAEPLRGHHADVKVSAATRLDWVFALANQSPPDVPVGWLDDYDSTKQSYELFVPSDYDAKRAYSVILFISPGGRGTGYRNWQAVCSKQKVIFASPHGAGNNCPPRQRVRIIFDVLDDIRRKYNTDVDRCYIGGFSGGGRTACAIAFALPEYFGGVIPVCAAGDLRQESWLKHRVIERLSVAHVTGEKDFNRGEVSRFRGPMLAEVGVRSRVWVVPKMGHGIPGGEQLQDVFRWLEAGVRDRKQLGKKYPASRISGSEMRSRAEWADGLLAEAKSRLGQRQTVYSGLMQLMGLRKRWPDVPAAESARSILLSYESKQDRPWEKDDLAEQRKFLIAQARALDAYATGELPKQYAPRRGEMAEAALNLWKIIVADRANTAAASQARKRIPVLEALVAPQSDNK
jgi:predicted esterase